MGRVYFPTVSLNRFGVRDTNQQATLGGVDSSGRFDSEPAPRASNAPTGPLLGAIATIQDRLARQNGNGGARYVPPVANPPLVLKPVSAPVPPSIYIPAPVPVPPVITWGGGGSVPMYPIYTPAPPVDGPLPINAPIPPIIVAPISSSGGGGAVPQPTPMTPVFAAPVSAQQTPTPVATAPAPAPATPLLVSSGGGVATPSTPTVTPAPGAASPNVTVQTGGDFVSGISAWLSGSTALAGYNVPNALIAGVVVLGFAWLNSSNTGKKR